MLKYEMIVNDLQKRIMNEEFEENHKLPTEEKLIEEYGLELAIEKVAQMITEKIDMYKETNDEEKMKELTELILDREKIYKNDKETIKKYLKDSGDKDAE